MLDIQPIEFKKLLTFKNDKEAAKSDAKDKDKEKDDELEYQGPVKKTPEEQKLYEVYEKEFGVKRAELLIKRKQEIEKY